MSGTGVRNESLQDGVCTCVRLLEALNNSREQRALRYCLEEIERFHEKTEVQSEVL